MNIFKRIAQTGREENGQTMVEFTLVLPVLLLVLFGIIQFGIVFNNYVTLTDAVRTGAREAAVSRNLGASGATTATKQAVIAAASDLSLPAGNVTVTSTWNAGDDVTVTASIPYSIDLLGMVFKSGNLKSTTTERVE